jgi:hypothetical protein
MSTSTTTAAEQINMDTLLPTYLRPRRARTFPLLDPHRSDSRMNSSRIYDDITAPNVEAWYTYVVENSRIIGVVIAGITMVVTIVGIIVGVVTTVVVK